MSNQKMILNRNLGVNGQKQLGISTKYLTVVFVLMLSACRTPPAIQSVHDIPIPPNLVSARDYDSAHETAYETMAKQLVLSMIYVWDAPADKTDMEFFVLPDAIRNEGAQHEFYQAELPTLGWKPDDEQFSDLIRRWYFSTMRGRQTFVTSYIRMSGTDDALVVRMLYPVQK